MGRRPDSGQERRVLKAMRILMAAIVGFIALLAAPLGVRMAEPLASNGFTPSFDPRRYLGVGPRLGLEGNQPLQSSWVVEWKVGAALLNGSRTFDSGAGVINSPLPNFANSGSVVN